MTREPLSLYLMLLESGFDCVIAILRSFCRMAVFSYFSTDFHRNSKIFFWVSVYNTGWEFRHPIIGKKNLCYTPSIYGTLEGYLYAILWHWDLVISLQCTSRWWLFSAFWYMCRLMHSLLHLWASILHICIARWTRPWWRQRIFFWALISRQISKYASCHVMEWVSRLENFLSVLFLF